MSVRVRFAPSPTGFLHVGGARTASAIICSRAGRAARSSCASRTPTRRAPRPNPWRRSSSSLEWLGLSWDEGPKVGGDYGPYLQSERREIYRRARRPADRRGTRLSLHLHRRGARSAPPRRRAARRRATTGVAAGCRPKIERGARPRAGLEALRFAMPRGRGRGGVGRRGARARGVPQRSARRLRSAALRRPAHLQLRVRGRRSRHGDHPRDPRRRPHLEHAAADPALPGAAAGRRPSSRTCR